MSVRSIARELGIGKSVAGEFVKAGMPSDDAIAARAWMQRHPRRAKVSTPRRPVDEQEDLPLSDSPDGVSYQNARADRERSRATRERMDLLEAQGRLVDVREAARAAATIFRILRDGVDNVPDRIGDALAAESDPFVVKQMIREELRKVFSGFNPEDAAREPPDEEEFDD